MCQDQGSKVKVPFIITPQLRLHHCSGGQAMYRRLPHGKSANLFSFGRFFLNLLLTSETTSFRLQKTGRLAQVVRFHFISMPDHATEGTALQGSSERQTKDKILEESDEHSITAEESLKSGDADVREEPTPIIVEGNPSVYPKGTLSSRTVLCTDSLEYLKSIRDHSLPKGYCAFTSIPDITELPTVFNKFRIKQYKKWFCDAASLLFSKMPHGSYTIFLQSDLRFMDDNCDFVYEWVDKSFLCTMAAERNDCVLMWHKIVSAPLVPSTGKGIKRAESIM